MTNAKPTHAKNADLTPQKLRFIEWLFADERTPRTQGELAAELGVEQATLSDWKRSDPIVKAALDSVDKQFSLVDLAQYRIAINTKHPGSTQAATYLAKRFGMFKADKLEVTGKQGLLEWLGSDRQSDAKRAN